MDASLLVDERETLRQRAKNDQVPHLVQASAFLQTPEEVQGHQAKLHNEVALGWSNLDVDELHDVRVLQLKHGNALMEEKVVLVGLMLCVDFLEMRRMT